MNRNTIAVAAVGLVSGALGAFGVALLSTPAAARDGTPAGGPYVIQVAVATVITGPGDLTEPAAGVLYRVWSDGTVDAVGFIAKPPSSGLSTGWNGLCDSTGGPATLCLQPLGVVPDDPATPADVNSDGKVDGADLGLVLGDWSQRPTSK